MEAAQQKDLQALGQILQVRVRSHALQNDALKLGCAMSEDGTLVILSQHPLEVNVDPEKIFVAIEQALESLHPQVTQSVKLFLRVTGQKQTYANYCFTLQPALETTANNASSLGNSAELSLPAPQSIDRTQSQKWNSAREDPETLPTNEWTRQERSLQSQIPKPVLIIGGGVVLATLLSSIYMVTRPCALAQCKPLQTAQQLNQAATHMMRWANSQSDLLVAQQQMGEANNLLKSIPRWSSRYQEASQLSQILSAQSVMLKGAIAAWERATIATQQSQVLPHTTQEWLAIQASLQEAIATLGTVPKDSPLFLAAQQKLPEYQAKLKSVDRQLLLEQQASKNLTLAQNTVALAKQRQNTAQSSQSWQKVKATWQTAVNALAAIPHTSTAYKEAQQLLKDYRIGLAVASDRASQEQKATQAFSEAMSFANLAKRDEQQNQFTKAINNWKQALNSARQIPVGTHYYQPVQAQIASYSSSLQQAQAKLSVANILQKVRSDLNRTCSGNIRVCRYTLNSQLIAVHITSGYKQTLERTFVNAKLHGDAKTQAGIVFHYRTLKQALETISNNAGIPLQVYQPNGSLIHAFRPK
jgi:tetratricopeptide (TPR) repeat protein